MRNRVLAALLLVGSLAPRLASAQTASPVVHVAGNYRIVPNITYVTANNFDVKLDVYQVRGITAPAPTLVYIHGGGWTGGSKEASALTFLPFLDMGWNVVNVDYRLAKISPAPAAVEDCRCALRWVYQHAKEYNIDTSRLVLMGNSSGGHLALTTGMLPASAGFDRECPGPEELKVAAILNWYGFSDVADVLEGPNMRPFTVTWFGQAANRAELATRVSPMTYVRAGLPPILTIHGDADPTSPYADAIRFRQALDKAGVPNELVTIPGGKHGNFTDAEMTKIYDSIHSFLAAHHVATSPSTNQ